MGQVRHQTFEHQVHKSLLMNVAQQIEVRVIRGSKSSNCWAPEEGESVYHCAIIGVPHLIHSDHSLRFSLPLFDQVSGTTVSIG
jgi:hypothetical protein